MKAIFFPVLLIVAVLAGPMVAQAQETYMALHVGYNLVVDGDLEAPGVVSTSYEDRSSFAGSYGYMSDSGFRVEGELGWRANDVGAVAGTAVAGRLTTLSLMVNVLYEGEIGGGSRYGLRSGTSVRPYIGLGAGGGQFSLDVIPVLGAAATIDDQVYALAWQGIVGLGFGIGGGSVLTLDYRYFAAENIGMTDAAATPVEIDSVQSTFMVGLRTAF